MGIERLDALQERLDRFYRERDWRRFQSLKDIAARSKIGVRYLEYIEADRHALLPAPVYLRGFLQEYARATGLEPQRTAEAYMSRLRRASERS